MFRILLVSSSGSFRAPLAAALLRQEMTQREVAARDRLEIATAGTRASGGEVDPRVVQLLDRRGVASDDVDAVPRGPLEGDDVDGVDLVLTMDRGHRARATELAPRAGRRIFCVREFPDLVRAGRRQDVDAAGCRLAPLVEEAADGRGLRPPPRTAPQDTVPAAPPRWPLSARRSLLVVLPAVRGVADILAPALREEAGRGVIRA